MTANIRLNWRPEVIASLHTAVLLAQNGKFIKLLQMPGHKRKLFKQKLSFGWEEVRQVLAKEYPDFKPTRLQVAGKWHKSKAAQQLLSTSMELDQTDTADATNHDEETYVEDQSSLFHMDWLREAEDSNYVCPHEIAKKEGTESSARTAWCPKAEASLHRAVLVALDGKFMELLELPDYEKKGRKQELTNGWEEVKQIMAEEHPEFEPTKAQIGDKWRKSQASEKLKRAKMKAKKKAIKGLVSDQFLMSSSSLDLVKTEFDLMDYDGEDFDDGGQFLSNNNDDLGVFESLAEKERKKNEAQLIQKKLEVLESQKESILRLEKRKTALLEAEHERRIALMLEESDWRKRLLKEEYESKLHILEDYFCDKSN